MRNEDIASLSEEERSALVIECRKLNGMPLSMIEKDIWVTYVLERIFADDEMSRILRFKGGTSLSKAHGLIERFSEDVDLILDWTRFMDLGDPNAERSKTKQGVFNEKMNETAGRYVSGELREKLQSVLGDICRVECDAVEPLNLHVVYPKSFDDAYLMPNVKLEIGPLASWIPSEKRPVTSFVAQQLPQLGIAPFVVPVIKAERTFWEKIEALHHEHYRPETKKAPRRFSRHYYDVYRMYHSPVYADAKANLPLLQDVVDFTRKFYPRSWAHFELCKPGTMLLQPSEHALPIMRADYQAMRQMIYGNYPSFEEILETLKELESDVNALVG